MKYFYFLTATVFISTTLIGLICIRKVETDSMEPSMMVGSWYFFSPILISYTPKVEDVVQYHCVQPYDTTANCIKKNGGVLTGAVHRITNISSNGCITIIGDNPKYHWETVPCFMPDEIAIDGVIHKLSF